MAYKVISKEKRKEALMKCIESIDDDYIKQVADKYDIDSRTLKEDCHDILKEADTMFKKNDPVRKIKRIIRKILRI
jgi:hypothetical protein